MPPALEVRARRRRLFHPLDGARDVHLVVVIVHVADVDVDFSPQLRPQRLPISLEDITWVKFLLDIRSCCDLSSLTMG